MWGWAFSDEEQHVNRSKRQKCEYQFIHHRTQYFQLSDDEEGSTDQVAKRARHDHIGKHDVGEEGVAGLATDACREVVARLGHYGLTSKGAAGRLFGRCKG